MSSVGVVIIGRNEGERLRRGLESVLKQMPDGASRHVVYVDSNSTDGSVALARTFGVEVVELDMSVPFTAARARNAGFARLREVLPEVGFVQFIDADCELAEGWMDQAIRTLEARPDVAVVCGRRRERHPEATVYNALCDMEWDTPIGEAAACGGDAMMRVEPLEQVGGFDETLIAGEEPELCVRLRQAGWKILRIDHEMTLHDAAMTRLGQWWKRAVRAGHAYAEGAAIHGSSPQRHNVRQVRSTLAWGLAWPILLILAAAAAVLVTPWAWVAAAVLLAGLALLAWRIHRHRIRRGDPPRQAATYAGFCVLAKLPQTQGVLTYWRNRLLCRRSTLIEYKSAEEPIAAGQPDPRS